MNKKVISKFCIHAFSLSLLISLKSVISFVTLASSSTGYVSELLLQASAQPYKESSRVKSYEGKGSISGKEDEKERGSTIKKFNSWLQREKQQTETPKDSATFQKKVLSKAQQQRDAHLLNMAENGNRQEVTQLLKACANVEAVGEDGATALHLAVLGDHVEVVKLLLAYHANTEAVSKEGLTALHIAALSGHTEVVKLLIKRGARIKAVDREQGMTPLHFAAYKGTTKVVKLLLDNKAKVDVVDREFGMTPLHVAVWKGHSEIVKILLDKAVRAKNSKTLLHLATKKGHTEIIALLT